MATEWPNIADVTAALESNDPTATVEGKAAAPAKSTADTAADVAAEALAADASKSSATPTESKPSDQQTDTQPKPEGEPEAQSTTTDLAALLKEDPRKALAAMPEDVIEALQAVLYPNLHRKLSKRDTDHAKEIERIRSEHAQALTGLTSKIDERIDEVLARTMDPTEFEEFKRQRSEKAEAAKKATEPSVEEVARTAEVRAYVTQAWDMIADEGFPLPEDRDGFSDLTDEVKSIWQAGWNEPNPIAAMRAMRAKARELKSGKAATPPRDPSTGRFQPSGEKPGEKPLTVTPADLDRLVREGVERALQERDVAATTAITGARAGGNTPGSGKAPTWEENRKAMTESLRSAQGR